ncbi:MAG: hypothetical protein AMXMBFR66_13440 [Pseudomonadota bacterium]
MGEVQFFLVRVWCCSSQFRASVRRVGGDELRSFLDARALGEFLRAAAVAAAAQPAAPVPDDGRNPPEGA